MKAKIYSPKYIIEIEADTLEDLQRIKQKVEEEGFTMRIKIENTCKEVNGAWV